MTTHKILSLLTMCLGFSALGHNHQVYWPMRVESATQRFVSVHSDVSIILSEELNTMTLRYMQNFEEENMVLRVVDKFIGGCGSTHVYAEYDRTVTNDRRPLGFRYSVHLTDHTTRRCRDLRPYLWEVDVESGLAQRSSAKMKLVGKPTK